MPILKAPPKQLRNATIQVRVEEEISSRLRKYAEFIDCSPAFVVAEALRLLFNKDNEFREWLARHADDPSLLQKAKTPAGEPSKRL
jgi:hypothetical protein